MSNSDTLSLTGSFHSTSFPHMSPTDGEKVPHTRDLIGESVRESIQP